MRLYLSKRSSRKIVTVIVVLVLLAWTILTFSLLFNICTNAFVDSVSIDDSSNWSKYFFSKSGYSTIRIRSHVASRSYVDDISTIGSNKPKGWFEEKGFTDIEEIEMVVRTIPKIFPNDGTTQRVTVMKHPMAPDKYFFYHPKTGVLLCN